MQTQTKHTYTQLSSMHALTSQLRQPLAGKVKRWTCDAGSLV